MKCSIVAAGLVVVVAAQNPSVASKISSLSGQLSSALSPPQSIVPELLTVVPSSVIAALADPTAFPALASSLVASPPAWFTSLPADAKSWLGAAEAAYTSIAPQLASLQAQAISAGLTTSGAAVGTGSSIVLSAKSTSTGYSNSTTIASKSSSSGRSSATTKATTLTSSATGAGASSSKASSSSSSGGASSPTGVVAAGVMGAVGILGMALAL